MQVPSAKDRPSVDGKFLAVCGRRLHLRGATYGTFAPDAHGDQFGDPLRVERDFAQMAANGLNSVRTYTVPPGWVLDAAHRHGLWVLVGLPWEQHVAFLGDRRRAAAIESGVRAGVASCAGHPALLGFAVGNEIPAAIVRWHGRRKVERFLRRLCEAVREEDPGALVTYVNYPSTEYLRLPFLDFAAFNVYLEERAALEAYLPRLHTLADERPLVLAEVGLDSARNGEGRQAEVLASQLRSAAAAGCAGAFVFAWTDEWHRGGHEVGDWDFGLVDRRRRPKPALDAVSRAFSARVMDMPRISVVVCTYNGGATIADTVRGVQALRYPKVELIVVDDGSTDGAGDVAERLGARVVRTANRGLSAARNTGLAAASGEIVAYLDDDAWPDPDWLTYVAGALADRSLAGVGGPNLAPAGDGAIAACVANAPGGPAHVLLADDVAEHIPGCNMAFRRGWLEEIGGFDPRFRVAGDDVDLCWRLQDRGGVIGFHPSAVVWHRRRGSLRTFWRQQRGYGAAEALLERKWPERYNTPGHVSWGGRLYGRGTGGLLTRSRVYYGVWGTGAFQPRDEAPLASVTSLAAAPEWPLVVGALAATSALGLLWAPLLLVLPVLIAAVALPVANALAGAARADFGDLGRVSLLRALTAALHLAQPVARLAGRLANGLSPWRRRVSGAALPRPRTATAWSESWTAPEARMQRLEHAARHAGARVRRGGACDGWDLEVAGGATGSVRVRAAVEEHGGGRQLLRCAMHPRVPGSVATAIAFLAALATLAAADGAAFAASILATVAAGAALTAARDCATATGVALSAVRVAGAQRITEGQTGAGRVAVEVVPPIPLRAAAERAAARPEPAFARGAER